MIPTYISTSTKSYYRHFVTRNVVHHSVAQSLSHTTDPSVRLREIWKARFPDKFSWQIAKLGFVFAVWNSTFSRIDLLLDGKEKWQRKRNLIKKTVHACQFSSIHDRWKCILLNGYYFVLFSSRVSVRVKWLCTWIYATFCCHYHSHTLTADKIKELVMTCCGVMFRVHWRTRMELKRSPWMRCYVCKSDSSMFKRLRTWLRLPIGGSNLGEWRLHHWSSMPATHTRYFEWIRILTGPLA